MIGSLGDFHFVAEAVRSILFARRNAGNDVPGYQNFAVERVTEPQSKPHTMSGAVDNNDLGVDSAGDWIIPTWTTPSKRGLSRKS